MSRMKRGFTIIELLVVISVIGILATITLVGFNRYQADARDTQRSSQATIISEALEKYYDANGEYPGCKTMTDTASHVISNALPGLDPKIFVTPQAASNQTNSIDYCNNITMGTPTDSYAYVGDGSDSCKNGSSCLSYTLEYKDEGTNSIKSITSRRSTNILTSGDITTLAASPYSFSKVDLSWNAVSGASTYNVRYSLSGSMSSPTSFNPASTNSVQVTGLTLGTTYYFQVQPAAAGSTGNWSNTASATTYTLDTPDGTAVPDPSAPASKIKLTWSSVANAQSYTVIYNSTGSLDGNGVLTSPTTINNATSPNTLSGLSAGATRYFQIKANASGYSSGWSSVDSATTTVPVPQNLAATTDSSTQITASWDTVSVANTYKLEYSTDSNFGSVSSATVSAPTTSKAVTGLSQGQTWYFRVYALVGSTSSLASSTANATTSVSTPGAPGVNASQPGAVRTCAAGAWVKYPDLCPNNYYATGWITSTSCPSGTSPVYKLRFRYNSPTTMYTTGATTTSQWYSEAARSGYYTLWSGQYYCHGPNADSSWGPWSSEKST